MNDSLNALSNAVPSQYHPWLIFGAVIFPYITRALHALASGRGLVGSFSAVLFGTNTPAGGAPVRVNVLPLMAVISASAMISLSCMLLLVGCSSTRLQPGGAYAPVDTNGVALSQPDLAFFEADSAFDLADSAVRTVLKFELDNREMLFQASPSIKHALDKIRPDIETAELDYAKARTAYALSPTPPNLSTLNQILAKTRALADAARAVMPTSVGATSSTQPEATK